MASSNLVADWERVRNACASYCSLRDDCDAFYLEEKQAGNCHLVYNKRFDTKTNWQMMYSNFFLKKTG